MRVAQKCVAIIACILAANFAFGQEFTESKAYKKQFSAMKAYATANKTDSALYIAEDLLSKIDLNKAPERYIEVARKKAIYLILTDRYIEGYEVVLELVDLCEEKGSAYCEQCAKTFYLVAKLHGRVGDDKGAIDYTLKICDSERDASYYEFLTRFYIEIKDSANAFGYSQVWIELAREQGGKELAYAYSTVSTHARFIENYDLELEYLNKSLEIITKNNYDTSEFAFVWGNLGGNYLSRGDFKLAREYLLIDVKYSKFYDDKTSFALATQKLVEMDTAAHNYEIAATRLREVLDAYGDQIQEFYATPLYELLKDIYFILGDQKMYTKYAEIWSERYVDFSESQHIAEKELLSQFKRDAMKKLREQMEVERKLQESMLFEEKMQADNREFKLYLIVLIIALGAVIITFAFWRYRILQSKKLAISELKIARSKHEQELLQVNFQEEVKQSRILTLELQMKSDYSVQIIEKLKELEELSKPKLKEFEMFIQNGLELKTLEVKLKKNLGEIGIQLKKTLEKKHSNLTDSELTLASYVFMKMSNSEIAISKGISVNSVKQNKYRFKKKLNLEAEDDLYAYLNELLDAE